MNQEYNPEHIELAVQAQWATSGAYTAKRDDNREKFVRDFVKAWVKVMNADRFDA